MSLRSRLRTLERSLAGLGLERSCPTCGAPGEVRVLIVDNGAEPQRCDECRLLLRPGDAAPLANRAKLIRRGPSGEQPG